jgi:8-oxo-dGTP pyrophosphatase MutT (NUDIX family)
VTPEVDPGPAIRPKAICVFRRGDRILVSFGIDPRTGGRYARALGGAIEFGERAADTIRREIHEELGADIGTPRLLGVLENIFEVEHRHWHEIIFVFDAEFVDATLYERGDLPVNEAACVAPATWVPLDALGDHAMPIYPRGLPDLLRREGPSP